MRINIAQAGYSECLTFALCSRADVSTNLRKELDTKEVCQIGNPKTLDFQVCRTNLISGLLRTINSNQKLPKPLKVFEISDVIYKTDKTDVGAKNRRKLACAYYNPQNSGFDSMMGLVYRIMQLLEVEKKYKYVPISDKTYLDGKCARIEVNGDDVGIIGMVHPEVILNFELDCPCSVIEIDLEYFHETFKAYD